MKMMINEHILISDKKNNSLTYVTYELPVTICVYQYIERFQCENLKMMKYVVWIFSVSVDASIKRAWWS